MSARGLVLLALMLLPAAQGCKDARHDAAAVEATASKAELATPAPAPAPAEPKEPAPAPKTASNTAAAPSIYELSAKLEDQTGKALALDAFRGRPVVVSMFYSGCKAMCPLLITRLQGIEAALPKEARDSTQFLLISFDPERDTPQNLTALATAHAIDTTHWSLTRTSASSVQEIAAVLDIRYRRLPNGEFAHSSIVTVLDRAGLPVLRGEDSELVPGEVAKVIAGVLQTP